MAALMNEWLAERARWCGAAEGNIWNTEYGRGGNVLPGEWLFVDSYGNPRYPGSFLPRFKKLLKRAGLSESLTPHILRHSSASLMIADGTDIRTVAARLGHSQTSTTLNIYAHSIAEANAVAAVGLGSRLFKDRGETA